MLSRCKADLYLTNLMEESPNLGINRHETRRSSAFCSPPAATNADVTVFDLLLLYFPYCANTYSRYIMAPEISKAVGHKAAPLDVTWNQRDLLLYVVSKPDHCFARRCIEVESMQLKRLTGWHRSQV